MKKGLLVYLLSSALAAPCSAKIIFDWEDSSLPLEKREHLEEVIKKVSEKYKENKYGDYSAYDFLASPKTHGIRIVNEPTTYWPGDADFDLLELNAYFAEDISHLEVQMIHEFSHMYDYTMVGMLKLQEKEARGKEKIILRKKRRDLEKHLGYIPSEIRASRKEYHYVQEIKERIPPSFYNDLQKRWEKRKINGTMDEDDCSE